MDANKIITLTVICYLYETRPVDFSCFLFIYLFIFLRILLLLSKANDRLHGPLRLHNSMTKKIRIYRSHCKV